MEEINAALAARQWGVVTTSELLAAGISEMELRVRVRKGSLIRVYRGVYRVGHAAPCYEAGYVAAVKACGEGALLMERAAAYHQKLLLTRKPPPPEVMCPTHRRVAGVKTRRVREIHPLDRAEFRDIPVTPVPRTLVDLAGDSSDDELMRACHEAGVKYGTRPSDVERVLGRYPNARGAGRLRSIMSGDTQITLSMLERRMRAILGGTDLPKPEMNRVASGRRVDCRWPGVLTAELISYRFHNSRHSWELDQRRRREARARGEEHRTYAWEDMDDPGPMIDEIRGLLASL